MKDAQGGHRPQERDSTNGEDRGRRAVGYVRVSTDAQATDGLSLDAQTAVIQQYCASQGLRLVGICKDVISGAKSERPGLSEALGCLQRGVEVLVVLKFDRLSRSIRHFCELYDRYFRSGEKELVAIRESIRLDSSLGRALVSILLVFAQMEREATAERTREAMRHIKHRGYHYGKVPYGFQAVPAPDQPRFKVLVENPAQQAVLARIKAALDAGRRVPDIAKELNRDSVKPPKAASWQHSFLYLLIERHGWHAPKPHNERPHSDEELKARMVQLYERGHTHLQIASILNEQKWMPLKASRFTEANVGRLLRGIEQTGTKYLAPREYMEGLLRRMEREHNKAPLDEPWKRPGLPRLAQLLQEAGYRTPKGHQHWWPAQVQQLLDGRFDAHYPKWTS